MGLKRLLSLFLALGLLLAACGDDDDTTEASTDDTTEETADDTATDTSEDDEGSDDDGSSGLPSDVDLGECAFMADFAMTIDSFDESALLGGEDGSFGDFIGATADALDEVADGAPDEIADAFRTMADTFGQAADELEGVQLDFSDPENMDPEAMQAFEQVGQLFSDPEFEAASTEIDTWMQAECPDLAGELNMDETGL